MAAIDLEDMPDLGGPVPPLFPLRLLRCMQRLTWLAFGLSLGGWLLWGLSLPMAALWCHGSAMALELTVPGYIIWYLWRH